MTIDYLMWEPDERLPFGPNAYDDACNSPDPADNGGVGRRHSGAVTMGFSGHVDVINFRKWERSSAASRAYCFVTLSPRMGSACQGGTQNRSNSALAEAIKY